MRRSVTSSPTGRSSSRRRSRIRRRVGSARTWTGGGRGRHRRDVYCLLVISCQAMDAYPWPEAKAFSDLRATAGRPTLSCTSRPGPRSWPGERVAAAQRPRRAVAQTTGDCGGREPARRDLAATAFVTGRPRIAPGATLTVRYRVAGRPRRGACDRPAARGRRAPAATLRLGRRPTNRTSPPAGARVCSPAAHGPPARHRAPACAHGARVDQRVARGRPGPRRPPRAGVFPVQGALRPRRHGRQVRRRAEGTCTRGRTSSPPPGTPIVRARAPDPSAGARTRPRRWDYVVLHGDDGRDYVFMHIRPDRLVADGPGGRRRRTARRGRRDRRSPTAPHLHFEIWPGGWYASKSSQPIDPLPDLLAWAASR